MADVKLVSFEEFDNMIESGVVVPSINPSYLLVKNYYENYNEWNRWTINVCVFILMIDLHKLTFGKKFGKMKKK